MLNYTHKSDKMVNVTIYSGKLYISYHCLIREISSPASDCSQVASFAGEGNGTPLQYSCLENPMDGGAWWAAVHGVARSWTRLSDFTFHFSLSCIEKEMATHSCVLAWRIPGPGECRVGHN